MCEKIQMNRLITSHQSRVLLFIWFWLCSKYLCFSLISKFSQILLLPIHDCENKHSSFLKWNFAEFHSSKQLFENALIKTQHWQLVVKKKGNVAIWWENSTPRSAIKLWYPLRLSKKYFHRKTLWRILNDLDSYCLEWNSKSRYPLVTRSWRVFFEWRRRSLLKSSMIWCRPFTFVLKNILNITNLVEKQWKISTPLRLQINFAVFQTICQLILFSLLKFQVNIAAF